MKHLPLCTLMLLFIATSYSVFGQPRIYETRKIQVQPPVVDGIMDEPIWNQVEWSGSFTQFEPYDGKPPSQPTFFKILYDDNNLYVGIMSYDSLPAEIARHMSRRDGFDGDFVEINIDSHHDKLTAYSFTVNAAGVKGDELVTSDGENWDETWDPIWFTKTSVNDTGWVAEMKIPYSQLRFGKKESHVWGIQVLRHIFRKQERSVWQPVSKNDNGWVSRFGELHGIENIRPKRQVDLVPYFVAKQEYYGKEEENPFSAGKKGTLTGGVDGKIGVSNNLTLDLTINPDFGQVEADPSEVNLTAYETFFKEKRPFFVEGNNIYDFQITGGENPFSSDNLFYSRRIGRNPHYYPDLDDNEYADSPENTTILGAFKLSGKTSNGWSVGILESMTDSEEAEIDREGAREKVEVEPFTNYFAARLEKDINKGNTVVGGMLTSTNRKIKNEEIDFLPDNAFTGGLNFNHYWNDKAWNIGAKLVFSSVHGDTAAMTNLQESPVRYFQRPDADYLKVDSARKSLQGHGGTVYFGKTGEGHWRFVTWVTWRSPGLELNDMGYLRSADEVQQVAWVSYRIWEPFSIFRSLNLNFNQWTGWDFGGRSQYYGGNVNINTQFKNYWGIRGGANLDGPSLSKPDLRGGPSLYYSPGYNLWTGIYSDQRKEFSLELSASIYKMMDHTVTFRNIEIEASYRPYDFLKFSVEPFFMKNDYTPQYVETVDYQSTNRYITAKIDQTTLGIVLRADWNITPDFTVQYYGQPFMSNGKYNSFNYVADPLAKDFDERFYTYPGQHVSFYDENNTYAIDENGDGVTDYEFDNPDYEFLQFRSNMVLRWEYIPGSTLYLVWSQGRTDDDSYGSFDFNRNWGNMWDIHPHNVFLIKLSYRLARK